MATKHCHVLAWSSHSTFQCVAGSPDLWGWWHVGLALTFWGDPAESMCNCFQFHCQAGLWCLKGSTIFKDGLALQWTADLSLVIEPFVYTMRSHDFFFFEWEGWSLNPLNNKSPAHQMLFCMLSSIKFLSIMTDFKDWITITIFHLPRAFFLSFFLATKLLCICSLARVWHYEGPRFTTGNSLSKLDPPPM